MALIKDRKRAHDSWLLLKPEAEGTAPLVPPSGEIIVPLALWQSAREQLIGRPGRLGLWLASDQEPADIAGDLQHFEVVAVEFPKFTNGRGYSVGRLLRERHGWRGELRAVGDIQRDQLFYLARCGFDAFDLRDSEDMDVALAAFAEFSESYQASVDQPQPLFRRRELAA